MDVSNMFFVVSLVAAASGDSAGRECDADKLAVYRVVFNTFWDRETFPRQYPEWRPPAQWSKMIGERVNVHIRKPSHEIESPE